jgi:hypothetical protein
MFTFSPSLEQFGADGYKITSYFQQVAIAPLRGLRILSRQVRGALAVAIPLSTTSVVKNTAALARGRGGLVAPCIVPQSVATRGLLAQNEHLIPCARVVERASCLLLKLAGASASAFLSRVLRWQGFKIATGSAHV